MKMLNFILIFSIIGFCFSGNFDCDGVFENYIKSQCQLIDPDCRYFGSQQKCTKPKACSGSNENSCLSTIHTYYNIKKCNMASGNCEETNKICTDYDSTWGDSCPALYHGGKGNRCDFSYTKQCTPHYDECKDAPKEQCNGNIPSEFTTKCTWKDNACKTENRLCDDTYYKIDSSNCNSLKSTNKEKKCFYLENKCIEYHESCEEYKGNDKNACESIKPLNSEKNGFDITKNCTFDSKSTIKCQTRDIMCEDYKIENETDSYICNGLKTIDNTNKRCVFDFENKVCKEEFISCNAYNNFAGRQKSNTICEAIILRYVNKKCVFEEQNCIEKSKTCTDYKSYQPKEFCTYIIPDINNANKVCKYIDSKCVESYTDCESYDGKDKETCESIVLEKSKCILENDFRCTTVKKTCSEAKNELECEDAKPDDDTKECIYSDNKCIENYKQCEYYIGHVKKECEDIIQTNGYKCIFENDLCKSIRKLCTEGKFKSECQLISKVSNPFKKVCHYDSDSGSCFENYKYCSDYRGDDKNICTKIKPYDHNPVSEGIDSAYKCVYEKEDVGCEKKLLDCSEAKSNENLCSVISQILIDTDTGKYCAYIDGVCSEQYQYCSNYKKNVEMEKCKAIVPLNHQNHYCAFSTEAGNKCYEEQLSCESLKVDDYEFYCKNLNAFCSYSNGICSYVEKPCADVEFMLAKSENAEFCENIKMDDPKKICTISADKLKCEEKDKEPPEEKTEEAKKEDSSSQNSQKDETQDNNSSLLMNVKGIQLVLVIICLLF